MFSAAFWKSLPSKVFGAISSLASKVWWIAIAWYLRRTGKEAAKKEIALDSAKTKDKQLEHAAKPPPDSGDIRDAMRNGRM